MPRFEQAWRALKGRQAGCPNNKDHFRRLSWTVLSVGNCHGNVSKFCQPLQNGRTTSWASREVGSGSFNTLGAWSHPDIRHSWRGWSHFSALAVQVPESFAVHSFAVRSHCENSELDEALDVLDRQEFVPTVEIYRSLLKACSKRKALAQVKRVHAHLAERGLEGTRFLGDSVVISLVKCGSLQDALQVFRRLLRRSVTSWTGVIDGYNQAGQWQESLRMYQCMRHEGVHPDRYTFVSLLKACGSLADLDEGRRIHAEAEKYCCASDVFVGTCLIDMYAKCGSLVDAQTAFDGLDQRDMVAWTALIAGYVQQGKSEEAFQLYKLLLEEGICADSQTMVGVLQACGGLAEEEQVVFVDGKPVSLESLQKGKAIHAEAWRRGYECNVFVGSTLISMYSKCGTVRDAQGVFDRMLNKNVVSWNAMLAGCSLQGQGQRALQLYYQMQEEGICPDARTFVSLLQACGFGADNEATTVGGVQQLRMESLQTGKAMHAEARRRGYLSDVFVGVALVNMYVKCQSIADALNVFQSLSQQDVVSWTALLAGYAQQGDEEKAFQLYHQMQEEAVMPNNRTFASVLQACGSLAEKEEFVVTAGQSLQMDYLHKGKAIHAEAQRRGYDSDVIVCSTLVSMYGKCGSVTDAQCVFDGMFNQDVVSWTALLAAYVQRGQSEKALQLYDNMLAGAVSQDERSFVIALQACGCLAENEDSILLDTQSLRVESLHRGKALHAEVQRRSYISDVFVGNTMISMYGKCGSVVDAQFVFDQLTERDAVSWTILLTAYVQQGQGDKALELYGKMLGEGVRPYETTFFCILQACGDTGALAICAQIHHILVSGDSLTLALANTLVHAYGKCARMDAAQDVFDRLPEPNVVSWNALIAGYARVGSCHTSLQCYEEMQVAGVKPNGVTFLSVLSACSHAGMVNEGVEYFKSMSRVYGIDPEIEHYVTIVDLLGRAGHFNMIQDLLFRMPVQPDLSMWRCLLGACQKYGNVRLGKRAFDCAVHLQPKDSALYILMSNIYSDQGMWDHAEAVNEIRQANCARKKPGQSWIEHEREVCTFTVGGRKHPEQAETYELLQQLSQVFQSSSSIS